MYAAHTIQQQSNGSITSNIDVSTDLITKSIDTNSAIKSAIKPVAKLMFAPVDCGNSHSNYIVARHQNYRLKSIFNQDIYVGLPQQFTGLNVFDPVLFSSTDVVGNLEQDVTGRYLVSATNKFVYSGRYFEKLEMVSSGLYTGSNLLV